MSANELVKKIQEALRANQMYHSVYQTYEGEIAIEVSWGDWKHDHLCLDLLLKETFNLDCIRNETTEEDGSDTYSSIHYYKI